MRGGDIPPGRRSGVSEGHESKHEGSPMQNWRGLMRLGSDIQRLEQTGRSQTKVGSWPWICGPRALEGMLIKLAGQ